MKYLYGDGTESTLSFNFLEYLRLTLEFSVAVLKSHTTVARQYAIAKKKKRLAKQELTHLNILLRMVGATLDKAESQISTPTASECVGQLRTRNSAEVEETEARLRSRLSNELAQIQDSVDWEYAENERRLEKLLLHYDIPNSEQWVDIRALDDKGYTVELKTRSDVEVDAVIQLGVPENHPLSRAVRVDGIDPDLVIKVPHNPVWGRKDVKLREQKLAKEYIVAFTHEADGARIALRNAFVDGHSGYDILFGDEQISVTRISKQQSEEPFQADPADAAALFALRSKINGLTGELTHHRRVLKSVSFKGVPLRQHTEPTNLVRRLLDQMGPVAREVAAHSRSPGELILKRVLTDDRREEIFASVAELRETYADLPEEHQALFSPLGFDGYIAGATVANPSAPPPFSSRPPNADTLPRPSAGPPTLPTPSSTPSAVPVPKPKS